MSSTILRRAAWVLLLLLAAMLPFELKTPVASAGPFAVTNVELALYLGVVLWLSSAGRGVFRAWTPVHTGVCLWAAALIVCAAMATAEQALVWKFTLRSLGGCALFFMVADLCSVGSALQGSPLAPQLAGLNSSPALRADWLCSVESAAQDPQIARQITNSPNTNSPTPQLPKSPNSVVAVTLVTAAAVSAIAGMLEMWSADAASALFAFKTQPSRIGSFLRASGTFQYANIAAMYWEATLPIAIVLAAVAGAPRWIRWLGLAAALVLLEAIVLSASRAALIVVALVLVTLTASGWLGPSPLKGRVVKPALGSLAVLVLLIALPQTASGLVALRFWAPEEATWYRARYETPSPPAQLDAGATATIPVVVHNESVVAWPASGRNAVALSYHWHDPVARRLVLFDGIRTPLPGDVEPGGSAVVQATVVAPPIGGQFDLQWDLVQEHVTWFSVQGGRIGSVPIRVLPRAAGRPPLPPVRSTPPMPMEERPPRMALWRAALRMWSERPLFGVGPDNYRHLWGPYLGRVKFDTRIHANNLFVEILVTLGAVGVVAFAALTVAIAAAWRRGWRSADADGRLLIAGLGLALATFYVHGLLDYFLEFTPTYALFWVLAGVIAGAARGRTRTTDDE